MTTRWIVVRRLPARPALERFDLPYQPGPVPLELIRQHPENFLVRESAPQGALLRKRQRLEQQNLNQPQRVKSF